MNRSSLRPDAEPTVRLFGERYQGEVLLKSGQGVETFRGTDLTENRPVIIKAAAVDGLTVGAQMRLEHEAGVLKNIHHPYLSSLLDFGRQDGLVYLVMPFIAGATLEERLRQGPVDVAEALSIGRCLLEALHEIHEQGVLHRDLKPANLLLSEGKATLIDFGLAWSVRLDPSVRDQPVGTARYIAPEQAGLIDQDPDERSDLYSAGVVLFEMLAGRPLFQGETLGEVLWQHMTERPPELRGLGVTVPRALDEVIQRLLRKDPRDRYQTAEAVLADLNQIARGLAKGLSDPPLVVGLRDRRKCLTEPAFVGREAELAALDLYLERSRRGEGGLVLLEAESGGGKTRLLQELAQRGGRKGHRLFRGQGLDHAAQRPFQLLVGVAADLLQACRLEPDLALGLKARLGDHSPAVCAALPELAEVLGDSTEALGPESFGQARSLQALSALLDALGEGERPALVVLDDCQWADELTLKLLGTWQKRYERETGRRHVALIVAYRSEEVAEGETLRTLNAAARVKLLPFGPGDIRRLAESMAGPLPHEAITVVSDMAEGSPFMAGAVLQGLVECGALIAQARGVWLVEPLALADVRSSRHAAAFLVRRVERLPGDVAALLEAGAILGKEFDLDLAAELAKLPPARAIAAVDEARRRHIVWARRGEARCAFVHDKLRQTLLERLGPSECEELHRRAAQHLEARDRGRVFELAYHFDAAGLSARALPYALEAAEKARAQHSLEVAEQQYRIAGRGAPTEDCLARLRIAEGLGDILMLGGRYDAAAQQFEAARELAEAPLDQAQVAGKLGELAFKRGDVKTATERIELALRQLGRRVPRWWFTFLLFGIWEVIVQFFHSLCPRWFLGRRGLENFAPERLALRMYSRLAHLYWFHRGTVPALWAHLRELNRAERYPLTPELAQAYSEHGPGMSLIGWFDRGITYAEQSLAMRKELGDLWGQGQSLHFLGIVLYAASRFQEAVTRCREAVRLLERTGDYWEVNIARFQIAASLYRLGDLVGAVAEARRMYQSGLELGDAQASGISLDVWARASLGQVPPEVIRAEKNRPTGDVQRNAQVLLAEGVCLCYAGKPAEAAAVLDQAWQQIRQAGVKNAWVAPVLPWLATALRQQAEQTSALTPLLRGALIRRGLHAARRALGVSRTFRNELPHALRELALLLAMSGKHRAARKILQRSLTVALDQGSVVEHALTLQAEGRLGLELDWPGAQEEIDQATRTMRQLEATLKDRVAAREAVRPATLSLADRFDTVLDAGRKIASALSREAVFAAVREAALRLLRGERCLVMKMEEGEEITLVSGEVHASFSRGVVRKALGAGRAIALVGGVPEDPTESVLMGGIRSALCAPIFVRGRAAGCFYVTHRQVAGLFGKDEERLADFIATLAGAALENAEGFGELRRLNQTLEQQVEETLRAKKRIQEQAALLDKARDAISVQDLEGRILYWNRSAERLYGWTAAEALDKKADELLYRGPSPRREEAVRLVLERGEWIGELVQVTRDGEEVVVESRWTLVRDEQGQPLSRLVVSTDITEKKKLEGHFLRAQRMESLGTLAGGIAHDMNNVLLPIMMSVELLKRDLPPTERLSLLADLETGARRGADMVKQILLFARGGEGKKVPVQLRQVLGEMVKILARSFPRGVQIRADFPADLWPIMGDATQVYQLGMNLCVNARDAMPRGGMITLSAKNATLTDAEAARLYPGARGGNYVRLQVADTGSGIPSALIDKIFDPFFTTKEFGKGTGLGLSTVLGIVKGHDGFLQVHSIPDHGTEFTMHLPAALSALSAPGLSADPLHGHGETILVVDDEPAICMITQKNLEAHGYRVLTARSGAEALDLFRQQTGTVRLVLTDMMMPGMDGLATIRALRQVDPRVRVIAASGLVRENEMADLEYQAFLPKPFKVERLLKTVREVLCG